VPEIPVDTGYPVVGADDEQPLVEHVEDGGERGEIAIRACEPVYQPGPPSFILGGIPFSQGILYSHTSQANPDHIRDILKFL
jgi:hypothetical protein